jgi:hypothetical protein
MADGVNVEDPAPPAPPTPAAVAPPPQVPEPPADPDEVGAIEVQGGKHVPLEALKAARAEARAAKDQAARLPQLEQQLAQAQGSLATFQQIQQQLQQSRPAPGPAGPDPELEELARSLDYFKPDGSPDLGRAEKHAAIIQRQATKIAQQMVGPLHEQTARTASAANYQAAANFTNPQGQKPKAETLNLLWNNLPPSYTADPRVAQMMPIIALGLEAAQGNGSKLPPAPLPPANAPLHTEGAGNAPPSRTARISDAERAVIEARGMPEDKYAKLTKDWKPGRATQLED